MDYQLEELLPIITKLAQKYTSKESSSVTYEVARMIMGAVTYCIDENYGSGAQDIPAGGERLPAQQMYEAGYDIVIRKVYEAKQCYEAIIEHFADYGCRNYHDTILNGMPAFFLRYDTRYNPQDHLLTLDYPVMCRPRDLCGIDLILEYLRGIYAEKQFLDCFEPQAVAGLLESIVPDYRDLYLDNICEAVLLRVIQCAMAGKAMKQLVLDDRDEQVILAMTKGKSIEEIQGTVKRIIALVTRSLALEGRYFDGMGRDFAVRLQYRAQL